MKRISPVTCTRCQTTSDTNFEDIFIQIPRETNSIEQGLRDWSGAELIANYHCRGYTQSTLSS